MLISNLSDLSYIEAYIVVKRKTTVEGTPNANTKNKKRNFKNNDPSRS